MRSYNPQSASTWVWAVPISLAATFGISVIYFPPGTEMVHFPGLAHTRLCIQRAVARVHLAGFPHSEILGANPACGSPRLIAACHVLHRLLAPRHPPYALSSLTIKLTQHVVYPEFRQSRNEGPPRPFSGTKSTDVEQARLSTICSARAEFADFISRPGFVRILAAIQNASLFSCQRSLCPARPDRLAPGETFALHCETIKNPASSAGPSRPQAGRVCAMLDYLLP